MWLVLALVVAFVLWVVFRRKSRERAITDIVAQEIVERLALGLIAQYPAAGGEERVGLGGDARRTGGGGEPLLFQWANAETVGRMRRTIVRAALGHLGPLG